MKTVSEVRTALVNTLKLIKVANGYTNNLPDDHINAYYDASIFDSGLDDAYPKCAVMLIRAADERLPGMGMTRNASYSIILVVKQIAATDDAVAMLDSYVADIEKVIREQESLMGAVSSATLEEFVVDGGVLRPEGCLIATVRTELIDYAG
jgi:hypothetical protein